ncbi:hypothetical protein A8L34_25800 [Bacillus sp. FJAT-27264]|uniref:dUTP diphosphatase n=1 Tax=Paenibacillus sp. (strain DSM 101736 / FJAT-27264) TaxID=1850362 RepID=UPI0008080E2E|nr:dUTP diphosphatase [Bacillus sp. FJAT-27264]OBZ07551.1 hypothetical protein A8L34_25800 [Bacillus sp. FJAT-27264]
MSLTLKEIQQMQEEFDKAHTGDIPFYEVISNKNIDILEHLIVCMVGEIGEFSNIVKKIRRGDFRYEEKKSELEEEIVDAFIYLLKITNQCNFNIEASYLEKMKKNKIKFSRYNK